MQWQRRVMTQCRSESTSSASVGGWRWAIRLVAPFVALSLLASGCAPSLAPATRPTAGLSVPLEPRPVKTPPCPYGLDEQGTRELLAGFELELGDEREKTKACEARWQHEHATAEHYRQVGEAIQAAAIWEKIGVGAAGAIVGALIAAGVIAAVTK